MAGQAENLSEITEVTDEDDNVTERYQEDPNAKLFRLGFTVDEAKKLIA